MECAYESSIQGSVGFIVLNFQTEERLRKEKDDLIRNQSLLSQLMQENMKTLQQKHEDLLGMSSNNNQISDLDADNGASEKSDDSDIHSYDLTNPKSPTDSMMSEKFRSTSGIVLVSKKTVQSDPSNSDMTKVSSWDCRQVLIWLQSNGFGEYTAEFLKERIDGKQLVQMNDNDFKNLGVDQQKDCEMIVKKVKDLQRQKSDSHLGKSVC
ncbi:hypothetical protein HELRODRAFT_171712 [Helobdella robusta]|uniref:SAM domain-containing protein n=1 Tax=Helobdella robusta TaxID=6412 RepID=T1F4K8_HELRO|nr:hypothetical protein HELRODRAFT_171712 [Helobdella robusta]ESO05336.1 hypothetical protein HELRODRAFT_171712 [Helobdella robusta]